MLPALPVLAQLVYSSDDEVLEQACWALAYLSNGSRKHFELLKTGICPRIIDLTGHASSKVQLPALRTVGNFVTGSDSQTQRVMDSGALPRLLALLDSPKNGIRKEACWTISNITAGTREQVQAVIEANIIPPLVHVLATAEFDIKKEAAWSISNAASGGSPEQIKYLVQQGCLKPLFDLLTCDDTSVVAVVLKGIKNVLKAGEYEATQNGGTNPYMTFAGAEAGFRNLRALLTHSDADVRKKASTIYYVDLVESSVTKREASTAAPTRALGAGSPSSDPDTTQAFGSPGALSLAPAFTFGSPAAASPLGVHAQATATPTVAAAPTAVVASTAAAKSSAGGG